MTNLLLIIAAALLLAYCSEHHIMVIARSNGKYIDLPVIIIIIMLSLFCGLRTAFNDTQTYISGFQNAPTLAEFWAGKPKFFGNPLFNFLQDFFRHHISDNYHLFFVTIAFFTISCFVIFLKKYSTNFTFSILLFFTLGLYISNFAAVKQCLAMAVLTLAIPKLLDRKYISYYLLVLVAILFHSYAIMFIILPLFTKNPWTAMTYITILGIVFVLFTFETTITNFLEYAEGLGKEISETEVFETQSINIFRLAVFSVPPLLSFVFQERLRTQFNRTANIMINMSILSFLVMCLGLVSAGNLFGRSAIYFEIGTIAIFPWMLNQIFNKQSSRLIMLVASICYFIFFLIDTTSFSIEYRAISIIDFFAEIF